VYTYTLDLYLFFFQKSWVFPGIQGHHCSSAPVRVEDKGGPPGVEDGGRWRGDSWLPLCRAPSTSALFPPPNRALVFEGSLEIDGSWGRLGGSSPALGRAMVEGARPALSRRRRRMKGGARLFSRRRRRKREDAQLNDTSKGEVMPIDNVF
jgi:hypothetical protein